MDFDRFSINVKNFHGNLLWNVVIEEEFFFKVWPMEQKKYCVAGRYDTAVPLDKKIIFLSLNFFQKVFKLSSPFTLLSLGGDLLDISKM